MAQRLGIQIGWRGSNTTTEPNASITPFDGLFGLEQVGKLLVFNRGYKNYIARSSSKYWYELVTGTVSLTTLLPDGARHVVRFCFPEECFGFDLGDVRNYSAEAVEDVVVRRYRCQAISQLMTESPQMAHRL